MKEGVLIFDAFEAKILLLFYVRKVLSESLTPRRTLNLLLEAVLFLSFNVGVHFFIFNCSKLLKKEEERNQRNTSNKRQKHSLFGSDKTKDRRESTLVIHRLEQLLFGEDSSRTSQCI